MINMKGFTKIGSLVILFGFCLMLGCKSDRLILNFCDPLAQQCDIETCESFQDAIIMIQLSNDDYNISLHKVATSVKYLENLTGIKSNIYSYEIPVYSTKDEMLKDIQVWIKWFDENICKQSSKEENSRAGSIE